MHLYGQSIKYIISASRDKTIKVWDITNGNLVRTLSGHNGHVNGIDINANGQKIVSASSDSTCKIWNFNDGFLLGTFGIKDSGKVTAVAWHPLENYIVSATEKSDIFYWNANDALSNSYTILDDLSFYPNPTSSKIFIEEKEIEKVFLINAIGVSMKVPVNSYPFGSVVDISAFPIGHYKLQVVMKNESRQFKIIKE